MSEPQTEQWQRHHPSSSALCSYIRSKSGPTVLLSFSTGKDAVVAWHQLRRHFTRIVPFYLYLVPGLSFVEESLAYYEDHFSTKIHRLPHPVLFDWLRALTVQSPEHCRAIELAELPRITYGEAEDEVRRRAGAEGAWVANGTRAAYVAACKAAGVHAFWTCDELGQHRNRTLVISPGVSGHRLSRTRAAEAFARHLQLAGWETASVYYKMD